MNKNYFKDLLWNYYSEILEAYNYLYTLRNMRELGKSNSDKVDIAPRFFRTVNRSLMYTLGTTTAKLFENDKKSQNLEKLLNQIEQNSELRDNHSKLPVAIKDFREKLKKEYAAKIERLMIRRDKFWAHNDTEYFRAKELPKDFNLKDIDDLLAFAYMIVNQIYLIVFDTILAPIDLVKDNWLDFDKLISHIQK